MNKHKNKSHCESFQKYGSLLTRVVVAAIFILAGIGKLFGPAPGLDGFTGMLSGLGYPIPAVLAVIVGIVELVGGIWLLVGWQSKWAASALAIIILFAIITVHLKSWAEVRYPLLLFTVLVSMIGSSFNWATVCKK